MRWYILLILIPFLMIGAGCSGSENQLTGNTPTHVSDVIPMSDVTNRSTEEVTSRADSDRFPRVDGFTDLALLGYTSARIRTNRGNITVSLYGEDSPFTVNNFLNLAKRGFYDGTKFHRVIKDFMIQGGDPNSKSDDTSSYGIGGPGYQFGDEFNDHPLIRGSLAMANSGPNTNGSQFFIVTAAETPWLDGKHVNFGRVTDGMDIVLAIGKTKTGERDIPDSPVIVEGIDLIRE